MEKNGRSDIFIKIVITYLFLFVLYFLVWVSHQFFFKFISITDFFFITLIINTFTVFYSIYSFFDMKIFHNLQGSKLNLKLKK